MLSDLKTCSFVAKEKRYQVKEKLGAGTFGQVFKVMDADTNLYYAKKRVQFNISNVGIPSEILHEASNLANWKYFPYILSAMDMFYDCEQVLETRDKKGYFNFILPLATSDFDTYLRTHKIPSQYSSLKRIVFEICLGLEFLHDHQLIHGDVKPQNILQVDGIWKVSDFGLTVVESKLLSRQIIQSLRFRAPEEIGKGSLLRTQSVASDIWAYGVVVFFTFLITENSVFDNIFKDDLKNQETFLNQLIHWIGFPSSKWIKEEILVPEFQQMYQKEAKQWDVQTWNEYTREERFNQAFSPFIKNSLVPEKEQSILLNLLFQIFTYEPADRLSMHGIRFHPFFNNVTNREAIIHQLYQSQSVQSRLVEPIFIDFEKLNDANIKKYFLSTIVYPHQSPLNSSMLAVKVFAFELFDRINLTLFPKVDLLDMYKLCIFIAIKFLLGTWEAETFLESSPALWTTESFPYLFWETFVYDHLHFRLMSQLNYGVCTRNSLSTSWACLTAIRVRHSQNL